MAATMALEGGLVQLCVAGLFSPVSRLVKVTDCRRGPQQQYS